jgi:hypothetical protein
VSEGHAAWTMGRKTQVALALYALLGLLVWKTMEAGRVRTLVLVILGGFALRLLLGMRGSRYD